MRNLSARTIKRRWAATSASSAALKPATIASHIASVELGRLEVAEDALALANGGRGHALRDRSANDHADRLALEAL